MDRVSNIYWSSMFKFERVCMESYKSLSLLSILSRKAAPLYLALQSTSVGIFKRLSTSIDLLVIFPSLVKNESAGNIHVKQSRRPCLYGLNTGVIDLNNSLFASDCNCIRKLARHLRALRL